MTSSSSNSTMTDAMVRLAGRAALVAISATVLAWPATALAAPEGGGASYGDQQGLIATLKQGLGSSVVALVVFAIVFAILAVAVWPKIVKGLQDRENKIREEIESAEMARQQAKDALAQYQQSLAQARAEAQKMLEQTRQQQTALQAELKAKADAELGQMRERAMRDIAAAKRAAVAEIYADAAGMAAMMAGKILRREVRAEDQRAMIEEALLQTRASNS